ncbi:hypothetical protein M408DRAFT_30376 [Serendipita vermifera MAFF 305830]|uniref:Uncharacterized protein n=1 Tax=Serendipita vermifera MAFF 305830 TaxID=933852 RepID=A0A0C2WS66_SERVB|nr:hypothetical protein M408DRAFT_30376 [Serendipita vermifera MAFF 305830]
MAAPGAKCGASFIVSALSPQAPPLSLLKQVIETLNCSDVRCQNVHDPNPAQDEPTATSNSYLPGSVLQNAVPIILDPTHFFAHNENPGEYLALYNDRVSTDSETAMGLANLLTNGTHVVGHPNIVEAISHTTEMNTNADRQSESLIDESSSLTNSVQPVSASGSHSRHRYNYNCVWSMWNSELVRIVLALLGGIDVDPQAAPAPTALKRAYASILLHQRVATSNAHNGSLSTTLELNLSSHFE